MKMTADQNLVERLTNEINDLKKQVKILRTNQISPDGYFILPSLSGDPAGAPNGSMYYNTGSNKGRIKQGGVWSDIA